MKRYIFPLFCLLIFSIPGTSQSIAVAEDSPQACSNAGTNTFVKSSTDGGVPLRNIYTGTWNNGGGPSIIKWVAASNRWELQIQDAGDTYILWYSTFASRPNPPSLAVGNWTDDGNGCNVLTNFSGTGTQSSLALPVELVDFQARLQGSGVNLFWQTASEHNNAGFHIERSAEGREWQTIGFVEGQGNTAETQRYSFPDEKPLSGENYYRLRQTDFDGATEYSKIVRVDFKNSGEASDLNVFPNPVTGGELTLFRGGESEEAIPVQLFNSVGQLLRSESIVSGNNVFNINDLSAGIYTIQVSEGAHAFSKKVWVRH